jgi:hypothetical protein
MNATRTAVWLGLLASLAAGTALAADAPAAAAAPAGPAAPGLGAVLESSGIAITGYLDASYSHLSGEGLFTSGAPNRVFDTQQDGFAVQQAAVNVGYQPKTGFGAFVNLVLGNDADVIAPYDSNPGAHSKFDVAQAYVQWAGSGVTIIGGKFVTLAGAEVIASPANPNFSRSILFGFAIPFTHTGVRATFTPSDTVTLILGVNNGWDDLRDTNTSKTMEVSAAYAPVKAFSIAANGYFGKERVGGLVGAGPDGQRSLVDVVATWNATDALTVMLNYDWGKQDNAGLLTTGPNFDAKWSGLAGYVSYTFNDQWKGSLRAEYLDDKDGYRTGVVQKWKEVTATIAYLPTKSVELRGEVRADSSDVSAFLKSASLTDTSKSQQSVGIQALFKF